MPLIMIQAYPKDEQTKREVVEEINRIFLEKWGCGQEAISIGIEEYAPEDWAREVKEQIIDRHPEKLMIASGKKQYQ
jgi:4-oxalocrotonate tautomerase